MNGEVDNSGRAIVLLLVRASADTDATRLDAWVDTAQVFQASVAAVASFLVNRGEVVDNVLLDLG